VKGVARRWGVRKVEICRSLKGFAYLVAYQFAPASGVFGITGRNKHPSMIEMESADGVKIS
jgi:hypothetical protein